MNITNDLLMTDVRTGYIPNRSSQLNLAPVPYGERILWCCDVLTYNHFDFAHFHRGVRNGLFFFSHLRDFSDSSNV